MGGGEKKEEIEGGINLSLYLEPSGYNFEPFNRNGFLQYVTPLNVSLLTGLITSLKQKIDTGRICSIAQKTSGQNKSGETNLCTKTNEFYLNKTVQNYFFGSRCCTEQLLILSQWKTLVLKTCHFSRNIHYLVAEGRIEALTIVKSDK